jgi:RHS repeat-associated protein
MELDGSGNAVREYAHYPGVDAPHSVKRSSDGAMFYYATEQPGHVSGVISSGNSLVNHYEYTPWGEAITTTEGVTQPLRYAAREIDTETGLYYMRARYYLPKLGRFMSEDPIGLAGGGNPFVYVHNNPVALVDPSGLDPRIHLCLDFIGTLSNGAVLIRLVPCETSPIESTPDGPGEQPRGRRGAGGPGYGGAPGQRLTQQPDACGPVLRQAGVQSAARLAFQRALATGVPGWEEGARMYVLPSGNLYGEIAYDATRPAPGRIRIPLPTNRPDFWGTLHTHDVNGRDVLWYDMMQTALDAQRGNAFPAIVATPDSLYLIPADLSQPLSACGRVQ